MNREKKKPNYNSPSVKQMLKDAEHYMSYTKLKENLEKEDLELEVKENALKNFVRLTDF